MIGFSAVLKGGFGSTGRLLNMEINHVDYEAFNDLHDGDTVDNSRRRLANLPFISMRIQIAVYPRLLKQHKNDCEESQLL